MSIRPHRLALFGFVLAGLLAYLAAAQSDRAVAASVAAEIRVNPSIVVRGGSMVITGTGFLPGPLQVRLDGVTIAAPVANQGGVLSTSVTLPANVGKPGLVTLSVCSVNFCNGGPGAQNISKTVRLLPKLSEIPVGIVRRALDFVNASKSSTESWGTAFLEDVAVPYFRPDVPGAAYWEIPVKIVTPTLAANTYGPVGAADVITDGGFVLLSTGEHDFPIAEWNDEAEPPSRLMQVKGQGQVVTLYKLAMTHHAGEAGDGTLAASDDQNPMIKIGGLNNIDLNTLNGSLQYVPSSDPNAINAGQVFSSGSFANPPVGLTFEPWPSWPDLKAGYTDVYTRLLQVKRQHAAPAWRYQNSLITFGIALLPGESYLIPILGSATTSLSGPGVPLVQTSTAPGGLQVTALSAIAGQTTPMTVSITYGDGRAESVRIAIIERVIRSQTFLPTLLRQQSAVANAAELSIGPASGASAAPQSIAAAQDTTYLGYERYSALGLRFGRLGQRVYDQFDNGEGPNFTECPNGCGSTAWAMLFGWADSRATWENQFGLYRQNGGVSTPDAVAPRYMREDGNARGALSAEGLGVANMMWEIRSDIRTFCFTSCCGATTPWDMGGAWQYANRRANARAFISAEHNWINNEWIHVWNQIKNNRTPVIIMTGSLGDGTLHYPVAFSARGQRVRECGFDWFAPGFSRCAEKIINAEFRLNVGWGDDRRFYWYPASTGFYSRFEPR